jgi:hypothetical protein
MRTTCYIARHFAVYLVHPLGVMPRHTSMRTVTTRIPLTSGCLVLLVGACAHAPPPNPSSSEPRFVAPEEIVILPDSGPLVIGQLAPRFPPRRAEGGLAPVTVIVAYVVDTSGRAEIATVSFLESPSRDVNDIIPNGFQRSVCDYLRDARFKPATADGQRRRALVIQPFAFASGAPHAPDVRPHREAMQSMPRADLFQWLAHLPSCDRRRADSFYR